MLHIQNLHQYYGGSHILRGVDMHLEENTLGVILGRNGVGKSTLMRCLMGVTPLKSGSIHLQQQDISKVSTVERVRLGMAYVPQGREIFPRLTVYENLLTGAASKRASKGIPKHIYELFPVLKEMSQRNGGDLSGGQQQQLAIARALMSDPKLLILDEPTEGIQPNIIQHIGRTLVSLVRDHGITVLLVEQYLDFVKEIADAYYVMNRGRIICSGLGQNISADNVDTMLSV